MFSFCYLFSASYFPVNFGNTVIPRHNPHLSSSGDVSRKTDPPGPNFFTIPHRCNQPSLFLFTILPQLGFHREVLLSNLYALDVLNDRKPIPSQKSEINATDNKQHYLA